MMDFLNRFRACRKGVAAIEFGFIAPIMVVMVLGSVEVSNYIVVARKVATLASSAADLTAQDTFIDDDEMGDILGAVTSIVRPYDTTAAQIRISSVVADADGVTSVAWSDAMHMAPRTPGEQISVPGDFVTPLQGVVMAEVSYTYQSPFSLFGSGSMAITDTFYLKPRRSTTVQRG